METTLSLDASVRQSLGGCGAIVEDVAIDTTRDRPPPADRMKTVVFGLTLLVALLFTLMGCERETAPPPSDASISDIQPKPLEDVVRVSDASDLTDATDAAADAPPLPSDVVFTPAPDVEVLRDAGPPVQAMRRCTQPTEGDPSIPPPRLVFPMSPMRVTSRRPTLVWELAPGTTGARIEFCRDPCCVLPIITADFEGNQGRPATMLPPGVVFWRARGRNGDRVGREMSFTWEFGVRRRDAPADSAWGTIRDINGDGFDDLATRIAKLDNGFVRIYWGSAEGIASESFVMLQIPGGYPVVDSGDFNGDGLADIAIEAGRYDLEGDAPGDLLVAAYGTRGEPTLSRTALRIGRTDQVGIADFNGDGFSDYAIGLPNSNVTQTALRSAVVYFGGTEGVGSGGSFVLPNPAGAFLRSLFGACAASGDLDGDGYGDLVISDAGYAQEILGGRGRIYVYRGSASGISSTPSRTLELLSDDYRGRFGQRMEGVGDINGDRLGDLIANTDRAGELEVLRGSRENSLELDVRLVSPDPAGVVAGPENYIGARSCFAPDLNGDGRGEIVAACPGCADTDAGPFMVRTGRVYLFRLQQPMPWFPWHTIYGNPAGVPLTEGFAAAVATGDYNGDGIDDLAIGDAEPGFEFSEPKRGRILMVYGASSGGAFVMRDVFGVAMPPMARSGIGEFLASLWQEISHLVG